MTTSVRRALYGKMAADTTLNNLLASPPAGFAKNIFYELAPGAAVFPYVIFQRQSSVTVETLGNPNALENQIWLVKGVDKGTDSDRVEAIQQRLDALLSDGTLSVSGADGLYLRRQSDQDYAEVEGGTRYLHAGSLFRLVTEPT